MRSRLARPGVGCQFSIPMQVRLMNDLAEAIQGTSRRTWVSVSEARTPRRRRWRQWHRAKAMPAVLAVCAVRRPQFHKLASRFVGPLMLSAPRDKELFARNQPAGRIHKGQPGLPQLPWVYDQFRPAYQSQREELST